MGAIALVGLGTATLAAAGPWPLGGRLARAGLGISALGLAVFTVSALAMDDLHPSHSLVGLALIVALLHFARSTDCHVVAEGIETEAERAVLEKLEVEFGQGYLFGRPAEASTWARPAAEPTTMRQRPALRAIAGGRGPRA